MKGKDYLFLTFKRMKSHLFLSIMIILFEAISINLLGFTYFGAYLTDWGYEMMNQCTYGGISNSIILEKKWNLYSDYFDIDEKMLEEINELESVRAIGEYVDDSVLTTDWINEDCYQEYIEPLINIQEKHYDFPQTENNGNIFHCGDMARDSFYAFDIRLCEGKSPEEFEYDESKDFLLYLGYGFRDMIPIGTRFPVKNCGDGAELIVAGYLEKGTALYDTAPFLGTMYNQFSFSEMDYYAICLLRKNSQGASSYLCVAEDGFTKEDVIDDVKGIYRKYNLPEEDFFCCSLEERAEGVFGNYLEVTDTLKGFFGPTFLAMFIGLFIVQIMLVMKNTAEVGTLYACGITKKNLFIELFIENAFKGGIAFGVAYMNMYYHFLSYWANFNSRIMDSYERVLNGKVLMVMILFLAISLIIAVGIPFVFYRKKSMAELIKGEY